MDPDQARHSAGPDLRYADDIKKKKKKKKKKKQCAELPQSCLYMQINAFAHFDTYYEKINSLIEKIKGDSLSTND